MIQLTIVPDADPLPPRHKQCTPASLGSGPQGEACKTCRHYRRVKYHSRVYLKCGLMRQHWTHGSGSDIKAKWPACSRWEDAE